MGSILDKVAKDTEDTANLYLYLYLRYIFGQPVSYQYLQILDKAKDEINVCILSGIPMGSIPGQLFCFTRLLNLFKVNKDLYFSKIGI